MAMRIRLAIAQARRPWAGIRFATGEKRAPEIIIIFRFPNSHAGIGHGDVYQREQPRKLNGAQSSLVGNVHGDLIVQLGRGTQAWRTIIRPESPDERLLFRSLRRCIATQVFHFVVRSSVTGARHGWRRRRAELARRVNHEWNALTPVRAECQRDQANWILSPVARLVTRKIIHANARLWDLRAIIETHR